MGLALTIVALVLSVASSVYSTVQQRSALKFNAEMANREANYAEQKARFDANQRLIKMRRLEAEQKVGYASSGISLLSGSAQDVIGDTEEQGSIDAALIRLEGQNKANALRAQAKQYMKQRDQIAFQSMLSTAGSVAGGVSSMKTADTGSTLLTNYGYDTKFDAGRPSAGY